MAFNSTNTFDNTFVGVLSELSNSFVAAISDILNAAATIFGSAYTTVKIWNNRTTQRAHLLDLSNAQLDDIGLNRGDAMIEAAKPFWRA